MIQNNNSSVYCLLLSDNKIFEENIRLRNKLSTDTKNERIQMTSKISMELIDLMLRSKSGPNRTGSIRKEEFEENDRFGSSTFYSHSRIRRWILMGSLDASYQK